MEQTPSNAPVMEPKPGVAGWFSTWMKAVTKPSEQTFVEIIQNPDATTKTALLWIFIAGTISGIFQSFLQAIYAFMGTTPQIPGLEQFSQPSTTSSDPSVILVSMVTSICLSPVAGGLSVIFFAIGTAIIQWIAKLFGGVGTFDKLAYAIAAISVPVTLVSSVLVLLGTIPYVGLCFSILSIGLAIYAIVLQIMAVKGVNQFGWGAAIGSVLIPGLVILFVCGCLVIGGLMLLGPAIADVFNQINQSLAP
jgi:hypothetical protein